MRKTDNPALISVIVPVYNVAQYLDQCLKSITGQTYTALEIILVDDGSTDESGVLCDEWASLDERICVIHKLNGGLSSARNRGIQAAHGKYISCVDSDDYIELSMYETLIDILETQNADVVACQFMYFNDKGAFGNVATDKIYTYTGRELCNILTFPSKNIPRAIYTACTFIYKNDADNKLYFEEGIYYEDVMYTINNLWDKKKVIFCDKNMYFYRMREDSITGVSLTDKHVEDSIHCGRQRLEFYRQNGNSDEIRKCRRSMLCGALACKKHCSSKMKDSQKKLSGFLKEEGLSFIDLIDVTVWYLSRKLV